jgi:hypothetical protein
VVAKIYGRYERLHGKRRSAVSPSYTTACTGTADLPDERMTSEQIEVRDKRDRNIEAAFIALEDLIAPYPRGARDALEGLCVEDRPVPGPLGDVKKILAGCAQVANFPCGGRRDQAGSSQKAPHLRPQASRPPFRPRLRNRQPCGRNHTPFA